MVLTGVVYLCKPEEIKNLNWNWKIRNACGSASCVLCTNCRLIAKFYGCIPQFRTCEPGKNVHN